MACSGSWDRRALFILLLLCLFVPAQVAALCGAPESHHAAQHCCLLCHLGSLPFLQVSSSPSIAPVGQVERLLHKSDCGAPDEAKASSNSSRAPPSLPLLTVSL
jgi:hypothetical protein